MTTRSHEFERFGRYLLLRRLAVSEASEVYLALDPVAEQPERRLLVIKRLRRALGDNRARARMFLDEKRVLERIHHPNVVTLWGFGRVGEQYYLAQEYVRGEALSSLVRLCTARHMRLPLRVALYVGAEIAAALHHAHNLRDREGAPAPIIHRDVTLGNIAVTFEGDVKMLDFGIAKSPDRLAKTQAGQIKGTLVYLAPEQLLEQPLGPATDIYQLGVLLYKVLVGQEPVQGAGEAEVMEAIVKGQVTPPRQLLPSFPRRTEQMLLRALATRPQRRFPSADAFAMQLLELLGVPREVARQELVALLAQVAGERRAMQEAFIREVMLDVDLIALRREMRASNEFDDVPDTIELVLRDVFEDIDVDALVDQLFPWEEAHEPEAIEVELGNILEVKPDLQALNPGKETAAFLRALSIEAKRGAGD